MLVCQSSRYGIHWEELGISALSVYYLASPQAKVKHRSGDGCQVVSLHRFDVMLSNINFD